MKRRKLTRRLKVELAKLQAMEESALDWDGTPLADRRPDERKRP